MHDNNKHEIKAKTKLTKSRLLRNKVWNQSYARWFSYFAFMGLSHKIKV